MAKVTREHFITAKQNSWDEKKIAEVCGVTKQAVYQMKKKYFPNGIPEETKTPCNHHE